MHRLLINFQYFLTFFLATFFQKEVSKDHSTQGNLLKATLLNEKQNNLEKKNVWKYLFILQVFFTWGRK